MKKVQKFMKRVLSSRYIYLVIFLIGSIIFAYPLISSTINRQTQTKVMSNYESEMKKLDAKTKQKKKEEAEKYNEFVRGLEGSAAAAVTDDEKKDLEVQYESALNIGEVMGYIEVPKLDLKLPIHHGTSEPVLQIGAGHLERTSLPIGGVGNHSVITAHRGLPEARMFRDINKLEIGDLFFVHTLDDTMVYEVDQMKVIEPTDTKDLIIDENQDLVTLLTCDPYMVNSHRLIVRGHRVEKTEEVMQRAVENKISFFEKYIEYFMIIFVFVIIMIVIWVIRWVNKNRQKRNIG